MSRQMCQLTQDSTRVYDDLYKIKIPSSYKYEHCMYQIINKYNNSNLESKMCGNLWSLKQKIKEDCLKSLRKCEINNCNICLLDNWRNYQKYMSKWLCIDFIHHFSINVFIVVVFFQCTQKKLNCWTTGGILRSICPNDFALILFIHEGLHHFSIDVFIVVFFHCIQKKFIHLSWMLTLPIPPLPLPTLAFQIKDCKPFPNLSMNWHFCQIQSSSSLLLKNKDNNTKRTTSISYFWGSRTSPPWRILGSLLICNIT